MRSAIGTASSSRVVRGSESVEEDVEQTVGAHGSTGLPTDHEDPDQARGDLRRGHVGAQFTGRGAGVEDAPDRGEDLIAGPRMGEPTRFDHCQERVEHAALRRYPLPVEIHPGSKGLRRGVTEEQFASARREAVDLVSVDGLDQRLARRKVAIERRYADVGLPGDGAHRALRTFRGEDAGGDGKQLRAVASGIRSSPAGIRTGQVEHAPVSVTGDTEHSPLRRFLPRRKRESMQQREDVNGRGTSRAVVLESFGGPEKLTVQRVPSPQAGPGQIRVKVTAAGLNPMDWFMTSDAKTAARFGLSLPTGYGTDYAGVVDQVGADVRGFAIGDRVYGAALSRALADHVVVDAEGDIATGVAHPTPDGIDDRTAATLTIAGSTAAAALAILGLRPDDTVLMGGAGGGVGVFAVQLARIAGARVIATGSASTAEYLSSLGAEPVTYGDGLADRVRELGGGPVTAALDLHGTDTVAAARELGVPDERICTIAAVVEGVPAANGANAGAEALQRIARLIADGRLRVPIAATFPLGDVRAAVELQAGRHVRGKVVVDL